MVSKTHGNCPWYWEDTIRKRSKKEKEKKKEEGRVKFDFTIGGLQARGFGKPLAHVFFLEYQRKY
jgi:hypothetical protein